MFSDVAADARAHAFDETLLAPLVECIAECVGLEPSDPKSTDVANESEIAQYVPLSCVRY